MFHTVNAYFSCGMIIICDFYFMTPVFTSHNFTDLSIDLLDIHPLNLWTWTLPLGTSRKIIPSLVPINGYLGGENWVQTWPSLPLPDYGSTLHHGMLRSGYPLVLVGYHIVSPTMLLAWMVLLADDDLHRVLTSFSDSYILMESSCTWIFCYHISYVAWPLPYYTL